MTSLNVVSETTLDRPSAQSVFVTIIARQRSPLSLFILSLFLISAPRQCALISKIFFENPQGRRYPKHGKFYHLLQKSDLSHFYLLIIHSSTSSLFLIRVICGTILIFSENLMIKIKVYSY